MGFSAFCILIGCSVNGSVGCSADGSEGTTTKEDLNIALEEDTGVLKGGMSLLDGAIGSDLRN